LCSNNRSGSNSQQAVGRVRRLADRLPLNSFEV
jgi:hypothetical protein